MSKFAGPFRRKDFKGRGGTYVTVYQRSNEEPHIDLNFFDGERSLDEAKKMIDVLEDAVVQVEEWKEEE
jgi:hypothetical protein